MSNVEAIKVAKASGLGTRDAVEVINALAAAGLLLPAERRAVQISTAVDSHGYPIHGAVCNDGTLWRYCGGYWQNLPAIPTL